MQIPNLNPNKPTLKFYIDDAIMDMLNHQQNYLIIDQPAAIHQLQTISVNSLANQNTNQFEHCQNYIQELKQYPNGMQIVFIGKQALSQEAI